MRKLNKKRVISVALLLFVILISVANAQRPGMRLGQHKGKHAKNIENLRMLKLLEILELDDGQSAEFITSFVSFRKITREIGDKIQMEVESLIGLLNEPKPSDEAIRANIIRIEELKIRRETAVKDFHKNVANILTIVQLGKMVIFEEHFERELIESMRGFRDRLHPPVPDMEP